MLLPILPLIQLQAPNTQYILIIVHKYLDAHTYSVSQSIMTFNHLLYCAELQFLHIFVIFVFKARDLKIIWKFNCIMLDEKKKILLKKYEKMKKYF